MMFPDIFESLSELSELFCVVGECFDYGFPSSIDQASSYKIEIVSVNVSYLTLVIGRPSDLPLWLP